MDTPVIATTALRKVYASGELSVEALRGVDLTVWDHEFVSIMGPSGSGKSTLLSIVGLLERPTTGTYELVGEDVATFDDRRAARVRSERIGFVFQAFNLLSRSTAVQNVELPLIYGRVGRQERRRRALEALDAVGLADRAEHLPSQLSGGQQQRAALARAIVTQPAVLMADEPTGNLDSQSEAEVLSIFDEVHARGATILM
ncbi:MAG: putative transport system ATP-binding protein, partial [Thermoleophilales bacterium]|nr:putative transport system ATP-binding protein [Thermoleophilales bacterium]